MAVDWCLSESAQMSDEVRRGVRLSLIDKESV